MIPKFVSFLNSNPKGLEVLGDQNSWDLLLTYSELTKNCKLPLAIVLKTKYLGINVIKGMQDLYVEN